MEPLLKHIDTLRLIISLIAAVLFAPAVSADSFRVHAPETWHPSSFEKTDSVERRIYINRKSPAHETVVVSTELQKGQAADLIARRQEFAVARAELFERAGLNGYAVLDIQKSKARGHFETTTVHSQFRDLAGRSVQMFERQQAIGNRLFSEMYLIDAASLSDRAHVDMTLDYFEPVAMKEREPASEMVAAQPARPAEFRGFSSSEVEDPGQNNPQMPARCEAFCKTDATRCKSSVDPGFSAILKEQIKTGLGCLKGLRDAVWDVAEGIGSAAKFGWNYTKSWATDGKYKAQVDAGIGAIAAEYSKDPDAFAARMAGAVFDAAGKALGDWFYCANSQEQTRQICKIATNFIPVGIMFKLLTKAPMTAAEFAEVATAFRRGAEAERATDPLRRAGLQSPIRTEAGVGKLDLGGGKTAVTDARPISSAAAKARFEKARGVLKLDRELTDDEKTAILKAHDVGRDEPGKKPGTKAGIGNYTDEQLRKKAEILREAKFTREQRRLLVEGEIVGDGRVVKSGGDLQSEIWSLRESGHVAEAQALEAATAKNLKEMNFGKPEDMGVGNSQPKKLTFADGTQGIWKPAVSGFGRADGEIAVYKLDKELGTNLVPVTVRRDLDGVPGTVQLFVKGTDNTKVISTPSHLKLFDYLTANGDRNPGNYLTKDGRLIAIDHGQTMGISKGPDFPVSIKGIIQQHQQSLRKLSDLEKRLQNAGVARLNSDKIAKLKSAIGTATEEIAAKKLEASSYMGLSKDAVDKLRKLSDDEWRKIFGTDLEAKHQESFLARKKQALAAIADAEREFGLDVYAAGPASPLVRARPAGRIMTPGEVKANGGYDPFMRGIFGAFDRRAKEAALPKPEPAAARAPIAAPAPKLPPAKPPEPAAKPQRPSPPSDTSSDQHMQALMGQLNKASDLPSKSADIMYVFKGLTEKQKRAVLESFEADVNRKAEAKVSDNKLLIQIQKTIRAERARLNLAPPSPPESLPESP